jgi:hypothetical protein
MHVMSLELAILEQELAPILQRQRAQAATTTTPVPQEIPAPEELALADQLPTAMTAIHAQTTAATLLRAASTQIMLPHATTTMPVPQEIPAQPEHVNLEPPSHVATIIPVQMTPAIQQLVASSLAITTPALMPVMYAPPTSALGEPAPTLNHLKVPLVKMTAMSAQMTSARLELVSILHRLTALPALMKAVSVQTMCVWPAYALLYLRPMAPPALATESAGAAYASKSL